MEPMYIARENDKHILSYVDFSKLCHVIEYCPELNEIYGQECTTFPISSSSRALGWQNKQLIEL